MPRITRQRTCSRRPPCMAVVLLMIVPLPPLLLDLLLSIDIGLAVVLLLTAIYVRQPVEFSVFPSLLLLLTLIRLSLNVASTRLVLMHGARRRRGGRPRHHGLRPVRRRRQLRRRRRHLPRPDRDSVHRHQPRRGPHLGSHGAVHPRRDARPADGDRRRPQRRRSSTRRKRASGAIGSAAKPTSTARWTAPSASRSATRWPPSSSPPSTSSPA